MSESQTAPVGPALRPFRVLADIAAFYCLIAFWAFLWLVIPLQVWVAATSEGSSGTRALYLSVAVIGAAAIAFGLKTIARSIVRGSRIGLVVAGVLLTGLAYLGLDSGLDTDASPADRFYAAGLGLVAVVLATGCLVQATRRDTMP